MKKPDEFKRYRDATCFLEGLSNLPEKNQYMAKRKHNPEIFLKRMRYFLDLLGSPDEGFRYIHIAGTSGKGSVTNLLHETLLHAGKKVGSFTSPFATSSIEKIKVGELYIDPNVFANILEDMKPMIDQAYLEYPYGKPSYFEIFFAIALIYFKHMKCEWVVLEVGLGGRFDATNVIQNPEVTAITNIDLDHTEILGKTLAKIGFDKAGIIKKGSVFFTTEERPILQKMFQKIALEQKAASITILPKEHSYRETNQILVKAIVGHIGISEKIVREASQTASLPCRFEIIQKNPLVIVDGAHNRAKMATVVSNLSSLSYEKLHLVIGIAENKDSKIILDQIIPLADTVYFTRFQTKDRKCWHPKELFMQGKKYLKKGAHAHITLDPEAALSGALAHATKNDAVVVTGSFLLAGAARAKWIPEEWILTHRKHR